MNTDKHKSNLLSYRCASVPHRWLILFCFLAPSLGATIRVTREPACAGEINPMQYGQFIEYLCDLVPSMWSEKLYDTSFEGLSPYKVAFIKETDFKEKPWYPSGATNRAKYDLDKETKVGGDVSQRIAAEGESPATAGLSQDGIHVAKDSPHKFSCYLRSMGLQGKVRIRLHDEGVTLAESAFSPAETWTKFSAEWTPKADANNATISIEFRGPGTLWIDSISLMPAQTTGGWRPDVVEAVRAIKPAVIRFGGSTLDDPNLGDFDWKDTIGDPDRRRPFRAWGGLQPTGPGLEEFVQFCRDVNAEPLICVRFRERTPKDAADQVEYFNGSVETPMGALRAKNGHAAPYAIKFWQVGNEIGGAEYAQQLAGFCEAMKKVDPSIQLFSSFPNADVLKAAGKYLDYISPHHYGRDLAGQEREIVSLGEMIHAHAPGRPIKLAIAEWNTTAGDWGPGRHTLWTLENALATSRYHNMMHRHADLVAIANRSNLINSFCSGIIQTGRRERLYKTPTYYAQQLYATLAGTKPLKIAESPEGLDISATTSLDGKTLSIFVINPTLKPIDATCDLAAFPGAKLQDVQTLSDRDHAGEPDVANTFDDPQRVAVKKSVTLPQSFAPLTLTVLRYSAQ
jgi:alpha-N-arabinofuranosidase